MLGRRLVVTVATVTALILGDMAAAAQPRTARGTGAVHTYIVRSTTESAARRYVDQAHGRVTSSMTIIDAVGAVLTPDEVADLSAVPGVAVSPDVAMDPTAATFGPSGPAASQLTAMDLRPYWNPGAGAGVGVALVDSGVASTPGLDPSQIVQSPDFAGDGTASDLYGHGTFMAGLIAGDGAGGAPAVPGVAPGVTLVSVKVAGADGSTDMSNVIAGIAWVVANQSAYNLRVLSISLGAATPLPPAEDPLDAAVEAAWESGITVVTAAGNSGAGSVTSPGDDPLVITVGSETSSSPATVPVWSGSSDLKPDVLAPGVSVTSLRAPGSTVDLANPSARLGSGYFRGSGTSMSTALVAGAAALVLQRHPSYTPDEVKHALAGGSGTPLVGSAGPVDLSAAESLPPCPSSAQTGSFGFDGSPGAGVTDPLASVSWTSGYWTSVSWTSVSWTSVSWTSVSWTSVSWTDESWS